jgi:hypothetical protein
MKSFRPMVLAAGEMNKSARAAPLLVCSASLGVVQVDMLRSLRERGVAPDG